jgi:chromosome segregation ATPase
LSKEEVSVVATNQPEQSDGLRRLENAVARFAEITMDNLVRHDEMLTRLEESSSRHDEMLTRLEESSSRHDEALTRLEESSFQHDAALTRIETAIDRLEEQTARNARGIEALTTSTTETIRLVADQSLRIEQILEYLFRERPNGRGGGSEGN